MKKSAQSLLLLSRLVFLLVVGAFFVPEWLAAYGLHVDSRSLYVPGFLALVALGILTQTILLKRSGWNGESGMLLFIYLCLAVVVSLHVYR